LEELLDILRSIRPDVDFAAEERLIDDNILDSFDVVNIVGDISEAFGVTVTAKYFKPENFNSVRAMWALVQRLRPGARQ